MYFQFLIEDISGERLIHEIMKKYLEENINVEYNCKSFRGVGHYLKGVSAKDAKTNKLLNDLPSYLKGFDKSLRNMIDVAIFIILDNDQRDPNIFRQTLEDIAVKSFITTDHVFCVAIEEMEAWLLGDRLAIELAYPEAFNRIARLHPEYQQDSICNTWEKLADILYKGGIQKFKKDNPTYMDVGRYKSQWARDIGQHLQIRNNASPSFQYMINALDRRVNIAG